MKRQIIFCSVVALFIFGAFAAQSRAFGQEITGGYGDASIKDKDVRSAANLAVKSRSRTTVKTLTLVKVLKAEVQVVAGLNYRVCLLVREGNRRSQSITAIVYKDLKNRRSLTNWKAGGCTDL